MRTSEANARRVSARPRTVFFLGTADHWTLGWKLSFGLRASAIRARPHLRRAGARGHRRDAHDRGDHRGQVVSCSANAGGLPMHPTPDNRRSLTFVTEPLDAPLETFRISEPGASTRVPSRRARAGARRTVLAVRLVDVAPDGTATLVTCGLARVSAADATPLHRSPWRSAGASSEDIASASPSRRATGRAPGPSLRRHPVPCSRRGRAPVAEASGRRCSLRPRRCAGRPCRRQGEVNLRFFPRGGRSRRVSRARTESTSQSSTATIR